MKTILIKNKFFAFFIPLFLFSALAIIHIGTMGINIDEAVVTLAIKDLVLQIKNPLYTPSLTNHWKQITLGRFYFPLSYGGYAGSFNVYLSSFFSYFDFRSIFLSRVSCVFVGIAGIIAIYKTLKIWINKEIAYLVFLLLCLNPTFVNATKIGLYADETTSIMFLWLGLLWLTLYYKRKKSYFIYSAFFIFGVAVWTNLSFGGYIIALFCIWSAISLKTKTLFAQKKHLFIGSLLFLAGISPILFNNYEALLNFKDSMLNGGIQGKLDIPYLAKIRGLQIIGLLANNVLPCFMDYFSYQYLYRADICIIIIGSIYLLFYSQTAHKKILTTFFLFYLIVTLLMFLTPVGPFASHVILIMPLPQLIIAFLAYEFFKKTTLKKITVIILGLLLARDIYVNTMLISDINQNRIHRDFSAALYPTIDWMDNHQSTIFYTASQLLTIKAIASLSKTDTTICNYADYTPLQNMTQWMQNKIPKGKPFYLLEQKNNPDCQKLHNILLEKNYILALKDTITTGPDEIYIYFVTKA